MKNLRVRLYVVLAALCCAWTGGCATYQTGTVAPTPIIQAQGEIPEKERLDVAVAVFDPGVSEGAADQEGVFPEVRKAESRLVPVQLRQTLQGSGQWGSVWVTPAQANSADVRVSGRILTSNWEGLALAVMVKDASGRVWLDKTYQAAVVEDALYSGSAGSVDPYQDLYNTIANDMVTVRGRLGPKAVQDIRNVARLRFASHLAPDYFGDYLREQPDGSVALRRLPARDDPMVLRIMKVKDREDELLNTLNLHYTRFARDMEGPYRDWQRASREEGLHYQQLKREGMWRKMLGAAAVVGAIAADAATGGRSLPALRNFAIIGGVAAFKSGMDKDAEARIHADAIEELGASMEAEAAPLTVEVEGQTRRLTGSAEQQYREWRRLLRDITIAEIGFTADSGPVGDSPRQNY